MELTDAIEAIARQERQLQFPEFDSETAWRLGFRLREMARSRSLAVVVDVRRFGQPLFYSALPGTVPDNAEWIRRKANVVARFHRSSFGVGLRLELNQTTLADKYGLSLGEYAAHGGAFPLAVRGAGIIGSIAVSGLAQRLDHELVVEGICDELGRNYADFSLPP